MMLVQLYSFTDTNRFVNGRDQSKKKKTPANHLRFKENHIVCIDSDFPRSKPLYFYFILYR